MKSADNPYQNFEFSPVAQAAAEERSAFIVRTYMHLTAAIFAFVGLEAVLYMTGASEWLFTTVIAAHRLGWLLFLGGFILVSWLADSWARSSTSLGTQYAGLSLYVVAESILFAPILFLASLQREGIIQSAAIATIGLFLILTAVVFITRKDFSFLRGILMFGMIAAVGLMICAVLFNINLGQVFTYAMIALACGYILYDTSNVMHHYRTDQYVAASLALFAAVALLFWYVLQLFMSRD